MRIRAQGRIGRTLLGMLVLMLAGGPLAAEQKRLTMWGTPPREKPHFTKAAEGFPPLPLPVVPQRRTEKKRPPAPPKLLANLHNFSFVGWKGSPGAVDQLLKNGRRHLNIWYGWEHLDIRQLERLHAAGTDHRTPILYLCAYYRLELSDQQRDALRSYALNGGTLLINCCGQRDAYESAKAELAKMFPQNPLRRLPLDHPLYHSHYTIDQVKYPVPAPDGAFEAAPPQVDQPRLEAIELGTRAAVLVSFEDLACGWNQWNNPTVHRVDPTDSTRLGLNIVTYVTAEQRLAKFMSKTRTVAGRSIRPRQQMTLVQLVHDGNWDPNPSATALLLKEIASNTSVAVQFERKTMPIKDPSLFNYPLLYMTGTFDPDLGRDELALLHRYLTNGGVLIADAAAGRVAFDQAFRQMCAEVLPDAPLKRLPPDHPLFSSFHDIDQVALNHESEPVRPVIEAVIVDDRPVIIYSPLGLGDGWAHSFSTYARCYATRDALKLGTNLIVYAMQ